MFDRPSGGEKAVLVHVELPGEEDPENRSEFAELAASAGADAFFGMLRCWQEFR